MRVAIALDLSGSMAGPKFAQAKEACRRVLMMLRPEDRLWLYGFSTELVTILTEHRGGPEGVEAAMAALKRLHPEGVTRTELGLEGMLQALGAQGRESRLAIIVTDGHATDSRGKEIADTEPLASIADRMAEAGISLSSVGLGNAQAFNTAFLLTLADRGKGSFIYAESPETLSGVLVSKLAAAQKVAATSTSIDLKLEPGFCVNGVCRLSPDYAPLEGIAEGAGYHVELGLLRTDAPTDILFDIEAPVPPDGTDEMAAVTLKLSAGGAIGSEHAALRNTKSYTVAQERNGGVDRDRLKWEINLYTTELANPHDPKKTAALLENIQRSATRAGETSVADEAAAQIVDLRKTGKLVPHRTTGLLTAARKLD